MNSPTLGKKRRRRRSDIGEVPYLHLPQYFHLADLMSGAQWEDMVHPTPKTLQWAAEGMQATAEEDITGEDVTNESNETGDTVEDTARKRSGTKYENLEEDSDEIFITQNLTGDSNYGLAEDSNLSSDVGRKSSLLTDLAHIGLQLAMWLVDTSDGRVSFEAGHSGICRATQTLAKSHGWIGSVAANLLRRTLADALAKHEPTRILLQSAGMAGKALVCQEF
ncbi:uncharacterized protein [Panulirus ornatus]|uniref:uncharacterized protein n=1 Tax=Panulirus ornatus TaxID=150431 RepID=UPI003A8BC09D